MIDPTNAAFTGILVVVAVALAFGVEWAIRSKKRASALAPGRGEGEAVVDTPLPADSLQCEECGRAQAAVLRQSGPDERRRLCRACAGLPVENVGNPSIRPVETFPPEAEPPA